MIVEQQIAALSAEGWEVWHVTHSPWSRMWTVRIICPAAHRYSSGQRGPTIMDNADVSMSMAGDTLGEALQNLLAELGVEQPEKEPLDLAFMLG